MALSMAGSAGLAGLQLPPIWGGSVDEPVTTTVTGLVAVSLLISGGRLFTRRSRVSEEDQAWLGQR